MSARAKKRSLDQSPEREGMNNGFVKKIYTSLINWREETPQTLSFREL